MNLYCKLQYVRRQCSTFTVFRMLNENKSRKISPFDISSGVPQGSILSPHFYGGVFNVYLDQLLRISFDSYVPAYADDLKVINSPGTGLQKDLNKIVMWSIENSLEINGLKCESIHFGNNTYSISGTEVPKVDSFRDLGLIVDSDLKFRRHVQFVRTKSLRLIGFLFKAFHSNLPSLYVKFYLSYILPIIDYSVIFYIGPLKSPLRILEGIQHVFTRRLFVRCHHSYSLPPYEERLKMFGLNKLLLRIKVIELVTLYKLSRGIVIGPKFIQFSLRFSSFIVSF